MERVCTGTYHRHSYASEWVPRYVALHRDLKYPCYRKNSDTRLPLTAFFGHPPYLRRQFS
jgi:hypothetical protein